MKYLGYLLICFTVFASCSHDSKESKKADVDFAKNKINSVLNGWHKNAAETNFEAYFNAMDEDAHFIGTDALEDWTIPQFKVFCKPFFDKGKAWNFKVLNRNVYIMDEFAWFDENLDTWMGICRGSGVLVKSGDSWKIKHYVLSLTIPNSNIKDVIKLNRAKDSIIKIKNELIRN